MYMIKNAFKSISRAKGRNILLGIIVLIIAVSACLGLSIRQASESAKEDTLNGMSVTATISFDRQSMINNMMGERNGSGTPGGFDRNQFADRMGSSQSLTLEEYQKYARADSVKDFYYTLSASLNGSDNLEPVSSDSAEETPSTPGGFGGMGGKNDKMSQMMGMDSDFSIEGYSSESAMISFIEGTATIEEGSMFTEGTEEYECIISQELAVFNEIAVGDTITFTNPNNEKETYTFKVTGIYSDSSANDSSFSIMGSTSTDPVNKIYTSYQALQTVVAASEENAETQTDENTGMEFSTALSSSLTATYSFADIEAYEQFEEEVRELGLDDSYTVSSSDITAYESSLTPLNTLSTMAGYFLLVILIIGAAILVVLNIFNVRERKYEIGVLTAMGMKKSKVAMQFLTEIFVVTLIAVLIGAIIGGVTSVPVTNALLENQIASQNDRSDKIEQNFGRGEGGKGGAMGGMIAEAPDTSAGGGKPFENMFGEGGQISNYITEINSAMNLTVLFQLLGIAVLLTLVAGAVSMLFVMRYDPLKILANRD